MKDLRKELTKVPCGEKVGAEMQPTFPSAGPGSWSTGTLTQGHFQTPENPITGGSVGSFGISEDNIAGPLIVKFQMPVSKQPMFSGCSARHTPPHLLDGHLGASKCASASL